jgi:class II lanthipeptide synthase
MNDHVALMAAGLAAVRVHSETSYSWFGQRNPLLPKAIRATIGPQDAREYILYALQQQLYHYFYCPGTAVPARNPTVVGHRLTWWTEFVGDLSAANNGTGSLEPGWRVHTIEGDHIVVERHGLHLWMKPDEVWLTHDSRPEPGVAASIRLPKELLRRSPGFYLALGNEGLPPRHTDTVIRLYWNLVAYAAPQLVSLLTTQLNAARIPFRLKVINDPERYTRCDAAVLYVPKRSYFEITDPVTNIYRELRASLQPGTPAFTKPLAPGLGLAEDPGTGDSFGMHRCRLFAEGIMNAHDAGQRSNDERLESLAASFTATGINCEQPYLNPGSTDSYPAAVEGPTSAVSV